MAKEVSQSLQFTSNHLRSPRLESDENGFRKSASSAHLPPQRMPLSTIPDPSQHRKQLESYSFEGGKADRLFGGSASDNLLLSKGSYSYGNVRDSGRGRSQVESCSAYSTPAKSVPRSLSFAGSESNVPRQLYLAGARKESCARASKGAPGAMPEPSVEVPHFDLEDDPSFLMNHNVQVLIRIRPLSTSEVASQGFNRCLRQESAQTVVWLGHPETRFTFDNIACETTSQDKLFRVAGLPIVENCISGYNSCMFAYGQTGSGKTYTMMGDIHDLEGKVEDNRGMTPRIFEYLFAKVKAEEEKRKGENLKFICKCSFLEIHNEQITDLLEPSSTNLQIRDDYKKGVHVENLTEYDVATADDVFKLLSQGAVNRKVAATCMNSESSRSHSVFTCTIGSSWEKDSKTHHRFGRLNLVDLAGSERQKTCGAEGDRLKEAVNINKSLSTLSLVIMSLVELAHGKQKHVPYRDSRLTFLLQDSLGGNSKTTMIANISSSICCSSETLCTLKFAQRAKLIQNNAKVNEDASGDVTTLQTQIQLLKGQLSFLMKHHNLSSLSNGLECIEECRLGTAVEESDTSEEDVEADSVQTKVQQDTGNQKSHDLSILEFSDTQKELMDAKCFIEELQSENMHLTTELHLMQQENQRYREILSNKPMIKKNLLHKLEDDFPRKSTLGNIRDLSRFNVQTKIEKVNEDIDESRLSNVLKLEDQRELPPWEQVPVVKPEAAKRILYLEEEVVALKLELHEKLTYMAEENKRLRSTIRTKDELLEASCIEWERAAIELTSFLLNGFKSLKEASGQIENIAKLFPQENGSIGEHVERAAKVWVEKAETILLLQKSLEDEHKMVVEVDLKLNILKGATMALTKFSHQNYAENVKESIHLHASSTDKIDMKNVEHEFKSKEDWITEADKPANAALLVQNETLPDFHNVGDRDDTETSVPSLLNVKDCGNCSYSRDGHFSDSSVNSYQGNISVRKELGADGQSNQANSLVTKFEEARATMEEADLILNALINAYEMSESRSKIWKQEGERSMSEKTGLVEEVERLKSSVRMKERENAILLEQIQRIMEEMTNSMSLLEGSFQIMQNDVEEKFREFSTENSLMGLDILLRVCGSRSLLEEIILYIMEKSFAFLVTYQAHATKVITKRHNLSEYHEFIQRRQKPQSMANGLQENLVYGSDGLKIQGTEITDRCQDATVSKLAKEEDILIENLSLKKELERKNFLLKGLLFDFSLLQESASNTKDIKDEVEYLVQTLRKVQNELVEKSSQLDDLLIRHKTLEVDLGDTKAALHKSNSDNQKAEETMHSLENEIAELKVLLEDMYLKKSEAEEHLDDQIEVVKGLEKEIFSLNSLVEDNCLSSVKTLKQDLQSITSERNRLLKEVGILNAELEAVHALADENEAISIEARQESEASKLYAEQKEEEVKILERSIEELEFTINVLEKKVSEMVDEVKGDKVAKELLELEAQGLRQKLLSVVNFTDNIHSVDSDYEQRNRNGCCMIPQNKLVELDEANNRIKVLEDERVEQAIEIEQYKAYISELLLHTEAQASQYQQKYKDLASMLSEVKEYISTTSIESSAAGNAEKTSTRSRGSSSPFRCIAGVVQQMNLERDQELLNAKRQIEELESFVASQKKEVCMLNTRIAAADSMTHDVIRDLLGVKLDVTNYANLIGQVDVQKVLEGAHQQSEDIAAKEKEIGKLMRQVKDLLQEKESYILEMNEKDANVLSAHLTIQQLEEQGQWLIAQNEMIKNDKTKLLRRISELEYMVKKNSEMGKTEQKTFPSVRKKEQKFSTMCDADFTKRLTISEEHLSRVNDELARYTSGNRHLPE